MQFTYVVREKEIVVSEFLKNKQYSRKLIIAIKKSGDILVNGKHIRMVDTVYENNQVTVILPLEELASHFPASNQPLTIIYEDDYLLIVSKPPHLETIPSKKNNTDTLVNRIKYYYLKQHINANIHIVTRLDKETSGLVIIAKNRFIHHLFSQHVKTDKKYIARVAGILKEDMMIEKSIKKSEDSIKREIHDAGQYAKTFVHILKQEKDTTLVELTLYTGRTHQIRIHLQSIMHPIIGDELYYEDDVKRLALHCYKLQFIHPITNQPVLIEDDIKNSFL